MTGPLESDSIGSELSTSVNLFCEVNKNLNLLSLTFCLVTGNNKTYFPELFISLNKIIFKISVATAKHDSSPTVTSV